MPETLTAQPHSRPSSAEQVRQAHRRRRALLVAAVVALIAGTIVVVFLSGGDDRRQSFRGPGFSMQRVSGWSTLSSKQLAGTGRPAAAGLTRKGGGLLLVRVKGRAPAGFNSFSKDLTAALDRRIPDFQKRSSRVIRVGSGNAFFYSYVRRTKGTVHTVTVVPAGARSYTIDTVTPGGDTRAARQAAQMILSFKADR